MTEKDISDAIIQNLAERQFSIYLTHFNGGGFAEADVFAINKSGLMFEYEIKISRSDYFADFKNKTHKHNNLQNNTAITIYDEWKRGKKTGNEVTHIGLSNRFYYVCPHDMIRIDEVPKYAGLIYIDGEKVIEIKKAPIIHKNKADERVYKRIATILSERFVWGMAYRTFKWKEKRVYNMIKKPTA